MKSTITILLPLWAVMVARVVTFSWGRDDKLKHRIGQLPLGSKTDVPETIYSQSPHSNVYAIAIKELQELESAPLCHRVASRLLVNSCELVDGKDEATILTDSGRQIRDFVDAYAASLAICDLERGGFVIPYQCAKLRENELNKLALQNQDHIILSSGEIDACLTALAQSDAAWSTWVSYRHKAVRFCEAARAENEKTQSIKLYQRLTNIIGNLAGGAELEFEKRISDLEIRARRSFENLEHLGPSIDELRNKLSQVHEFLSVDLDGAMKQTSDRLNHGLETADTIQQLLGVLQKSVLQSNAQFATAVTTHENELQQVTIQANNDARALMAIFAATAASSVSLQQQLEFSQLQAAELIARQDTLEHGMKHLLNITQALSNKHDDHTQLLDQANNITCEVLETLEDTVSKAASVKESLHQESTPSRWWPYIICPTASLVMGSYGLPPSAFRNLGLLALGETVGFVISFAKYWDTEFISSTFYSFTNGTDPGL